MSTSSLSLAPPPPLGQSSVRQKLSLPRLRSRTNSSVSSITPFPYSGGVDSPRSAVFSTHHTLPMSRNRPSSPTPSEYSQAHLDTRSVISRSPSPVGHPYANPELARPARGHEHSHSRSNGQDPVTLSSNDSLATLMSSEPTMSSVDTYAPSTAPSSPVSNFKSRSRSKDISGPLPLSPSALRPRDTNADGKWRETRLFPTTTGNGILGWQEPQSSAFTLISLEEARAQRSRTGTGDSGSPDSEQNPPSPVVMRSRVQSTSSAGRTRYGGESSRAYMPAGKSEPEAVVSQGKSLKHKKSGFMSLFTKEKDRTPVPPSYPSFPAAIPPVPRALKVSTTHRVPVPPLSPQFFGDTDLSTESSDSHESTVNGHTTAESATSLPSPKRVTPALSINTSGSTRRLPSNGASSNVLHPPVAPFATSSSIPDQPKSAPPGAPDFLAPLKLRPVSTMFSSHFTDHIIDPESASSERSAQPWLDKDTGTPTSINTSPLTADFPVHTLPQSRSEKSHTAVSPDDQSDIVRALQDQISVAQQAWQRHIWELEGQVRDLKSEIEELKHADGGGEHCHSCGRGHRRTARDEFKGSVLNRPRAPTGNSGRFVSTLDS